jgi:regulator of ribonuclease activity B
MDDNSVLLVLAVALASLAIILLRMRRRKAPGTAFVDFAVTQPKNEPPRIEPHKPHTQRNRVERERQQFDLPKIAQPIIEHPRIVQPVIEKPAIPQPVVSKPVLPQPIINQPVMPPAAAAINQPVMPQPVIKQPVVNQPVVNQPVVNQPVVNQPVVNQPAINQPIIEPPIIEPPIIEPPIIEPPIIEPPIIESSIIEPPIIESSIIEPPIIEPPIIEPPAAAHSNLSKAVTQPRQEPQKGEAPTVKTEPQKPEQSIKVPEVDQNVLDQLREAGSDLSKPHDIEFFLYFPNKEAAGLAAERIKGGGAGGFTAEVKNSPQGDAWMCYVTRKMVPDGTKIALIGERFRTLAQELGGEYDGWETSLVI